MSASTKFVNVLVSVWRKTVEVNGDYEKIKLLAVKELLSERLYATFVLKK